MIGSLQPVLFEEPDGEFFTGHAPNYGKVWAKGENLHNQVRKVKITGIHREGLWGELLP